ncbi:MAG: DUF3891 family protein [Chlorobi bacterium]|nr:DUF3891 family protein [Chlorobiota bacterium]
MIVTKTREEVIAIKQEDHAAFAAFLLERWSDHGFKHDERREAIIRATSEHDNGWGEFDAAPRIDNKTRLPVNFKRVTPEETNEIWMRGSQRFVKEEPYVAMLITHHAYALHESAHKRSGIWNDFFVTLARQRAFLRDALGLTHNDIEHSYSFLRMADWFSLKYCSEPKLGANRPDQYAGYKVMRDDNTFRFRPYPFIDHNIGYELPVYVLDRNGYKSREDVQKDFQVPEMREIILNPLEL